MNKRKVDLDYQVLIFKIIMNRADIVVGVERVLEDIGQTAKWNQKKLTWTITHHNPTFTRQHQI